MRNVLGPELAEAAARDLEDAPAEDILAWAAATFGARFAVTSSMQDGVLPHLISLAAPGTDVLFLEDPRSGRWAGMTKTECGIHQ